MNIIPVNYPPPDCPLVPRDQSTIRTFVVHHSAGPKSQTPLQIDAYERVRPDPDCMIPYTWMLDDNGIVYSARNYIYVSGATFGCNATSVAVCCIGNFQKDDPGYNGPPSDEMLGALVDLRVFAQRIIPALSETLSHDEAGRKYSDYTDVCCGSDLKAFMTELKAKAYARFKHA